MFKTILHQISNFIKDEPSAGCPCLWHLIIISQNLTIKRCWAACLHCHYVKMFAFDGWEKYHFILSWRLWSMKYAPVFLYPGSKLPNSFLLKSSTCQTPSLYQQQQDSILVICFPQKASSRFSWFKPTWSGCMPWPRHLHPPRSTTLHPQIIMYLHLLQMRLQQPPSLVWLKSNSELWAEHLRTKRTQN